MQRLLTLGIALVAVLSLSIGPLEAWSRGGGRGYSSGKSVSVRGYTRRDGTYVRPYVRSAPRASWKRYLPYAAGGAALPYAAATARPAAEPAPLTAPMVFEADAPSAPDPAVLTPTPVASPPPVSAPAPAPAPIPPAPRATEINDCAGEGWCYITINPDGTREARANPVVDISYPRSDPGPFPRLIIVNHQP